MTWRDHLAWLLGAASPAVLSTTEALAAPPQTQIAASPPAIDRDAWVYTDPAERQRLLWLAGHRSHSSHSSHSSHYSGSGGHASHSSHSSHYSGSSYGGNVAPPVPAPPPTLYSPPAAPQVAKPAPRTDPAPSRLTSDELDTVVRRLQLALIVNGYDPGPVDGVFSTNTRAALKQYQTDVGLPATGLMDIQSLRRLGVVR